MAGKKKGPTKAKNTTKSVTDLADVPNNTTELKECV